MPQQPVALPPILTEVSRADGFRSHVWLPRRLAPGEKLILERTLIALQQRDIPVAVNKIRFHVGSMLNYWAHQSRLLPAEKDQEIAGWEFQLREFSEGQIAEACAHWVAESRFKPVPADIIALARNIQHRDRESIRRTRVLLGLEAPRNWEKPKAPPAASQSRDVKGLLATLAHKITAPAAKKAAPTTSDWLASRDPQAVEKLAAMRKASEKAS